MRPNEKGFALVELAVGVAIVALIGSATATAIFQVITVSERSDDHMTAVQQVQNAGYWVSHDAQIAEGIFTDDLGSPNFLVLTWTEHDYSGGDSTYHSVTYFFDDLSSGVGELKRNHWSSAGADQNTLIAKYIYYDPADPDSTSKASYQSPVLTVKLTTLSGEVSESREYRVVHRPNFN